MTIILWPCFALFFVFLSGLQGADAAPTEPVGMASLIPSLLGIKVNPKCSTNDLQSASAYLGTDLTDQLEACALGGLSGRGSCPPGGVSQLIAEYPNRIAMYTQQVANCGQSAQPGSSPGTGSPGQGTLPGFA